MEIKVNNQTQPLSTGTTLQDVAFFHIGEKQKGIAIAVNNSVIPRSNWKDYRLQPNDDILIIKATQGG